jgi:NDP-sugar pyrophosphorylase family protein
LKAVIFSNNSINFGLSDKLSVLKKSIIDYQIEVLKKSDLVKTIIVIAKNQTNARYKQDGINFIIKNSNDDFLKINKIAHFLSDEPFFLFYGNILTSFNLDKLLAVYKKRKADIVFLYEHSANNSGYYASLDKHGVMTDLSYEKTDYKNYLHNIFCINPDLLTYTADKTSSFFEQFLPEMLELKKKIVGLENKEYFTNISIPRDLYNTAFTLLEKEIFPISGSRIDKSYYGDNCDIDFSVIAKGKHFFGRQCSIGKESKLANNIIYDNVRIGNNCNIADSILYNNVNIADNCEIIGSIIGDDVVIENNVRIRENSLIAKKSVLKEYSGSLDV